MGYGTTQRYRKQPPAPPGMRRELSGIIFDALLDGLSRDQVALRLKAAAHDPGELAAALRRFDMTVGVSR